MQEFLDEFEDDLGDDDDFIEETWMNFCPHDICDLSGDKENSSQDREFHPTSIVIGQFFDDLPDSTAAVQLEGLQSLTAFLTAGEYPEIDVPVQILELMKNGIDANVDSNLIAESFRVMSLLLHCAPPSNETLFEYWHTVLYKTVVGIDDETKTNLNLRECFMYRLKNIYTCQAEHRPAATAYLGIICELLEIDLLCFLKKNANVACANLLLNEEAPLIACLYWPTGRYSITKTRLLEALINVTNRVEDFHALDSCNRLFSMLFEITRLSANTEVPSHVSFTRRPPQALRELLKEIVELSGPKLIKQLSDSTPFSWVKKELREPSSSQ